MRLFWPIQSSSFPKIYNQHLGVPSSLVTSWRWLSRRRIFTVTLHVILGYCWRTGCLREIWSFPKLIFNFTTRFNERLFNINHQPTTHQRWIRRHRMHDFQRRYQKSESPRRFTRWSLWIETAGQCSTWDRANIGARFSSSLESATANVFAVKEFLVKKFGYIARF